MPDVGRLTAIIEADSSSAEAAFDRVGRAFDTLAGKIKQGFGFALGFTAFEAGIHAIGDALNVAGESAIGFNAKLESTQMGLEVLAHSAEGAKAEIAALMEFGRHAPVDDATLLRSEQRLRALGVAAADSVPLVEAITTSMVGMGRSTAEIDRVTYALSQMLAGVIVNRREMRELTNVGVPAWQILADSMHRTIPEVEAMVTGQQVLGQQFVTAYEGWVNGTFAGALERSAHTMNGALQLVKTNLTQLSAEAFQPIFGLFRDAAAAMAEFLQSERVQRWAEAIKRGMELAVAAIQAFVQFIRPAIDAVGQLFDRIADALGVPEKVIQPANAAGLQAGQAMADGMAEALGKNQAIKATIDAFGSAIAATKLPLVESKNAVDDIKASYQAAIQPIQDQIDSINRITDLDRDRAILQLSITESALKEQEARQGILKAAKDHVTVGGNIRLGKDPTLALQALDLQTQKAGLEANKQMDELNKKAAKAPLEAQVDALKKGLRDAIAPIEEMNRQTENQVKLLEAQRQKWEAIKKAAGDAAGSAGDVTAALSGPVGGQGDVAKRVFDPEAVKARLGAVLKSILDWVGERKDDLIKKFQTDWGPALWKWLEDTPEHLAALGRMKDQLFTWIGDRKDELTEKWAKDWGPAVSAWLPGAFESVKTWLKDNAGEIIGAGLFGAIGLMTFGPMGALIGAGLGAAIGQGIWDNNAFWAKIYDIQHAMTNGLTPDGIKVYEDFKAAVFSHFKTVDWFNKGDEIGENIGRGVIQHGPDIGKGIVTGIIESVDWSATGIQAGLAFGEGVVYGILKPFADLNQKLWDTIFDAIGQAARRALGQTPEGLPRTPYIGGSQYTAPIGPLPAGAPTTDLPSSSIRLFPNYPPPPTINIPEAVTAPPPIRQATTESGLTPQSFGYIPTQTATTVPPINLTVNLGAISGDVSDAQVQKIRDEVEAGVMQGLIRTMPAGIG